MTIPAREPAGAFEVVLPARPYPGLRPFEKREWPIFFGRERMTDDVIARIVDQQLVVVHGNSGSGKSSLIKAGVLARLEQESAREGMAWRTCEMQPRDAPLLTLARTLAQLDAPSVDSDRILEIRRVLNFGADAPPALAALVRREQSDNVCILVDQFEQLFAFGRGSGREEAALFVRFLVALLEAPQPGLNAVITIRSEFLGACAQFPGLAEAINRSQYLLPRMSHSDLLRAIQEPARIYGGQIDQNLALRLIAEGGGTQDELPLIQHALMLLHDRKRTPEASLAGAWRLDVADYEDALRDVAGMAGLKGPLSTHADNVATLAEPTGGGAVERLFRALTAINAEGHAIRRPQAFARLVGIAKTDESTLRAIINTFRAHTASFLRAVRRRADRR